MEYAPSRTFTLEIKVSLEEVNDFKPSGENSFPYYFKVRCTSCQETSSEEIFVKLNMNQGRKIYKCKKCHYKGNIIMETGYGRPYKKEDSTAQRFVPLMRFKCMNLEPLDFVFKGVWTGSTIFGRELKLTYDDGEPNVAVNGKNAIAANAEARFVAND